ncbi:MAG: esterase-like activity of phytase family protein [Hyphomicrobium sp.]
MSIAAFFKSHGGRRLRLPAAIGSVVAVVAVCASVAFGGSKPSMVDLQTGPLTVDAKPLPGFSRIDRAARRFGRLTWRGGLVLTSPSQYFGGWSGLVLDPDGKGFLAITDAGAWMSGALTYDDKGAVSGMSSTRIGAIQSKKGDPLSRKKDSDAEGITLAEGTSEKGSVYISFERKHRIARYDVDSGGLSPARSKVSLPKSARNMPSNGGFEALAVLRGGRYKGKLVAFSERLRDGEGNYVGWIWEDEERPRKFYMTNDGDYDITDASPLPDGSLLVLERRFRFSEGVSMRLRHIKANQLRPGRVIDADILIAADGANEIDNMEGLATHVGRDGEIILTMISDDNYNHALQRTLLLQFQISQADLDVKTGGSNADGR